MTRGKNRSIHYTLITIHYSLPPKVPLRFVPPHGEMLFQTSAGCWFTSARAAAPAGVWMYTLFTCTLYTVHCTLYTVHCTLYTVHCTLYTVLMVHTTHLWLFVYISYSSSSSRCMKVHTVHMYTVHCILYTLHCILYTVHSTLYTAAPSGLWRYPQKCALVQTNTADM